MNENYISAEGTNYQNILFFFGSVFLILMIYSIRHFLKIKKIIKQGNSTIATVIRSVASRQNDTGAMSSETTQRAVFEYTVAGVRYEKKDSYGQNPPKYKVGQKVEIYYDPLNPNNATLKGREIIVAIFLIIFGVLGIGLFLIGLSM